MPPIRKKNRDYKKGEPFRDARKFIIICEGERESDYFNFFDGKSRKLYIKTIPPVGENQGESAPNHLKIRASEYIDENGWDDKFEDQLWFVLDIDNWPREKIEELNQLTDSTTNWFLGLSNPCFEVWLYYHKTDIKLSAVTSSQMKQVLHEQITGGYKLHNYAAEIEQATANSEKVDENDNFYPDVGVTKLYNLGKEIIQLLQNVDGKLKLV